MTILGLHIVDVLVIVLYFAFVLYIGYRSMKRVRTQEDYFLGGSSRRSPSSGKPPPASRRCRP